MSEATRLRDASSRVDARTGVCATSGCGLTPPVRGCATGISAWRCSGRCHDASGSRHERRGGSHLPHFSHSKTKNSMEHFRHDETLSQSWTKLGKIVRNQTKLTMKGSRIFLKYPVCGLGHLKYPVCRNAQLRVTGYFRCPNGFSQQKYPVSPRGA